jgi:hypothetical protein
LGVELIKSGFSNALRYALFPIEALFSPQSQVLTSWLSPGPQPHAPIRQEFGKSPVEVQQNDVATVPPDSVQAVSADLFSAGVPSGSWIGVSFSNPITPSAPTVTLLLL